MGQEERVANLDGQSTERHTCDVQQKCKQPGNFVYWSVGKHAIIGQHFIYASMLAVELVCVCVCVCRVCMCACACACTCVCICVGACMCACVDLHVLKFEYASTSSYSLAKILDLVIHLWSVFIPDHWSP